MAVFFWVAMSCAAVGTYITTFSPEDGYSMFLRNRDTYESNVVTTQKNTTSRILRYLMHCLSTVPQ
jgi:hypothetical protein